MTIPGRGDLAPPRHHVAIGRWLVTLVVILLLAAGGYFAFLGLSGGSPKSSGSSLPLCPTGSTAAHAPNPGPLRLTVKNATMRNGLAASVSAKLKKRGFHVLSIGNTVLMKHGVASVRYSADRRLVAAKVAAQIAGSTLVPAGGHGVVELDLGPGFRALASPAVAAAAYLRLLPHASPSPTPTTTGSCRPRA